jgi:hypothetical protein
MRRTRAPQAPAAPLGPRITRVLLEGWGGRGRARPGEGPEPIFGLFMAPRTAMADLWRQHERFLRAEAARLGIAPGRYGGRRGYYAQRLSEGWVDGDWREGDTR